MPGSSCSIVPIALVALVACQPEPPPGTATTLEARNGAGFLEFKNGSRLAAKRIEMSGGEPILIGIFDTKEQVDCTFLNARDNRLRCLPTFREVSSSYVFADETCKNPVYIVPTRMDLSKGAAIAIEDPLVCEGTHRYAVKLFTPFLATTFWQDGKNCVARNPSVSSPSETVVIPSGERPPSDWVAGEVLMRHGVGRIRSKDVFSADGGRFSQGLSDEELGARCDAIPKGGDTPELVCWPTVALGYHGHHFGDATCQTAPLALSMHTCEVPVAVEFEGSYSSIGKRWRGAVYGGNGYQCVEQGNEDSRPFQYYEIGERIEKDPFATLEAKRVGSGRLAAAFAADGGQPLMAKNNPFDVLDSRLGKGCRFVSSPNEGLRCLPDEMFIQLKQTYFSDSSCTVAVMACDACEGKEVALSDPDVFEQFPATDIRRIGAEASGVYYERGYDNGKEVCKGPLDVRDWRGPKGQPIPLPHLWRIGAATSWDRFEQVFVRSQL